MSERAHVGFTQEEDRQIDRQKTSSRKLAAAIVVVVVVVLIKISIIKFRFN